MTSRKKRGPIHGFVYGHAAQLIVFGVAAILILIALARYA